MKLRWIVEEDGTRRLQFATKKEYGRWDWQDVPEVPVVNEYDEDEED